MIKMFETLGRIFNMRLPRLHHKDARFRLLDYAIARPPRTVQQPTIKIAPSMRQSRLIYLTNPRVAKSPRELQYRAPQNNYRNPGLG